ncbi:50S ribosomal protein L29 [Verrucomicrobium sp. GAS474]|uniref:50S ribosomal protein L29 n=1 Tax=Verrucomicrobium sp. GAS474 TaxID=1882831 RepID=UPI000B846652
MTIQETRNLSDAELASKKQDARQEIFNLRLQQQTGALEKTSRLGELRKDIAKIETVSSERRKGLKIVSKPAKAPKTTKKTA